MTGNPFLGKWRITEMEQWDRDFIDEEMKGYVKFGDNGESEFHFGYVHGFIEYEIEDEAGRLRLDFSWQGNDEKDEANGRGWARIENDGTMYGKIAFHGGERSWFKGKRMK